MPHLRPIVILGPTAGGKSELAVCLAERLGALDAAPGQIISADSMQVYRHMEAGTAKPSGALRRRAMHHLIDIVEPTQRFTVAHWLSQADAIIARLLSQNIRPIVVGGTNLYIRALLEGIFEGPAMSAAFRTHAQAIPVHDLYRQLAATDPVAAGRIAATDRRRITRALEVIHLTGKPISSLQQQWREEGPWAKGLGPRDAATPKPRNPIPDTRNPNPQPYRHDPILIGLAWPAQHINPRINLRVKAMFHPTSVAGDLAAEVCPSGESLPQETARLEAAGLLGPQAREALGYKQLLSHLSGQCSLDEAFEQTKIQTRRFARQQRTWLRRFRGVHWLEAADNDLQILLDKALAIVEAGSSSPTGASEKNLIRHQL